MRNDSESWPSQGQQGNAADQARRIEAKVEHRIALAEVFQPEEANTPMLAMVNPEGVVIFIVKADFSDGSGGSGRQRAPISPVSAVNIPAPAPVGLCLPLST